MKRIVLLLFTAVIAFSSCENIEDNSPAMQGMVDSVFFKALDVRAQQNEDGSYLLQGINQEEILTLQISAAQVGRYELGPGQPNFAIYEDGAGNQYSTSPLGSGFIDLTDSCVSCGTLTGSFQFMAINEGIDSIQVNRGFFFEANFLEGGLLTEEEQFNDGTLYATIDGVPFEANTVTGDEESGMIVIRGTTDDTTITVRVPVTTGGGNYIIQDVQGYTASITTSAGTEQANTGIISVNFHNPGPNGIRIFFRFETDSFSIDDGDTFVNY